LPGVTMNSEQKTVALGAASGVVLMALSVWLLMGVLPAPKLPDLLGERLAYALRANLVAIIPFVVMIVTVGNSRFLSEAIDPTRHAESRALLIDGRVADNTLQQNFIFALASLTLSTVLPLQQLQLVWACAIVFSVARAVFWLGYRISPLYRAPGMAATGYLNLGMIFYLLFKLLVR